MINGFININKPTGMTSSDVVVIVRGILRRATGEKYKVGHLGTLDPMASGVLPIAIGKATRLFDYLQDKTKEYEATFKFGVQTDTLDSAGEIVATSNVFPTRGQIEEVIKQYNGYTEQIPPSYSAKSINGKRAYDLARAGVEFDLKPKRVRIDSVSMIDSVDVVVNLKSGKYLLSENEYAFKITCGGGTYIRSIARDVATTLGTVGYMTSLVRTKSQRFEYDSAISIQQCENSPLEYLKSIDFALDGFAKYALPDCVADKVLNGVAIKCDDLPGGDFIVTLDGECVAIGEAHDGALRLKTRLK